MEEGKEVGPIEAEKGWGMGTVAKEEQTTERTPLVASTDVDVENGGGGGGVGEEGGVENEGKKKKEKKKGKDAVKGAAKLERKKEKKRAKDDDIKTHMSNERTFFKWLFFGFHLGGFGTFIITFFPPRSGRIYVVLFIWLIGFYFMYYGLYRYFVRRRAMRLGLQDPDEWDDRFAPALMAAALFIIVGAIIGYAIFTDQVPSKKGWRAQEGKKSP